MRTIFDELDSIVSMSISDPSLRLKYKNLLTTDFVKLLGPGFYVVPVENPHKDRKDKSYYFYVFDSSSKVQITNSLLGTILKLAVTVTDNPNPDSNDIRRLTRFENQKNSIARLG